MITFTEGLIRLGADRSKHLLVLGADRVRDQWGMDAARLMRALTGVGSELDTVLFPSFLKEPLARATCATSPSRLVSTGVQLDGPVVGWVTYDVPFGFVGAGQSLAQRQFPYLRHYPLGSGSFLDWLYQINADLMMFDVGHEENPAVHLAEAWADVPYARDHTRIDGRADGIQAIEGFPGCSGGFGKIGPVLRQARIERSEQVEGIALRFMAFRPMVSMAISMLKGDPSSLLCAPLRCSWCDRARKLCEAPGIPQTKGISP